MSELPDHVPFDEARQLVVSDLYPVSPAGLRTAIGDAIAAYPGNITRRQPTHPDGIPQEQLILYPNATNPRHQVEVLAGGLGQTNTGLRADGRSDVYIRYSGGRRDVASGTYSMRADGGLVRWDMLRLGETSIPQMSPSTDEQLVGLIGVMSRSSAERPLGRTRRAIRTLGQLASGRDKAAE